MSLHRQGRGRPRRTSNDATLSSFGITRDQSSKWQQLAAIPEAEFIALLKRPGRKRTTAGILREYRMGLQAPSGAAQALDQRVDEFRARYALGRGPRRCGG
jgi:hypothetical protein